jgi:hypothetical protein
MIEFWNTLLKDEPAWGLLISAVSLAVSVILTVWVAPALAKKQARDEFVHAFDLATRQELAARHGAYRDQFRELLDFLNPSRRPVIDSATPDGIIDEGSKYRIAETGSRLEHFSQFMGGYAFMIELQLLSNELMVNSTDATQAVDSLRAELLVVGRDGIIFKPLDQANATLAEKWLKAGNEVATLYKRIFRTTFY